MFINNLLGQNENLSHRDIKNDLGIMQLIPGAICPYNKINGTGFFCIFFPHTLTFFLQWAVNIFFDLKVNVLKLTKLIQNLSEKQELIKPIAYCHKMFLSSTVFNVINM